MILHLQGRPCRQPETPMAFEASTPDWSRVNCTYCRMTKKYDRLRRQVA